MARFEVSSSVAAGRRPFFWSSSPTAGLRQRPARVKRMVVGWTGMAQDDAVRFTPAGACGLLPAPPELLGRGLASLPARSGTSKCSPRVSPQNGTLRAHTLRRSRSSCSVLGDWLGSHSRSLADSSFCSTTVPLPVLRVLLVSVTVAVSVAFCSGSDKIASSSPSTTARSVPRRAQQAPEPAPGFWWASPCLQACSGWRLRRPPFLFVT